MSPKDPIYVGPQIKSPTHDLKLTDISGKSIGLILCDRAGKLDPKAIKAAAMPRTPLQTMSGSTGFDDLELPYVTEVQQTWIAGRAQSDFGKDKTRFLDSFRMDTTREFPICGPKETLQEGVGEESYNQNFMSELMDDFIVNQQSEAISFRTRIENSGTITSISMRMSNGNQQRTFDYHIELTDGGEALNASSTYSYTEYTFGADGDQEAYIIFPIEIVVQKGQDINIILKNFSGEMTIYYSSVIQDVLITEQLDENNLPYIITNEANEIIITSHHASENSIETEEESEFKTSINFATIYGSVIYGTNNYMKLFSYKKQVYAIVNDTNEISPPNLYINGYRGAAKNNAGNLYQTRTDLTLQPNELKGMIIYIINGPGERELQPWRTIESNTANNINVTEMWNAVQTSDTEYVILGSNKWTEIEDHGLTVPVTDIAITKDYVVFAQGEKEPIRFMKEYNNSGTWTRLFAKNDADNGPDENEEIYADLIEVGQLLSGEIVLWKALVDKSLVSYSFIKDWDVTGSPLSGAMLKFDVSLNRRKDLILQRTRAEEDKTTEEAKDPGEQDEGYILTLERMIADYTYQIVETENQERYFLPYEVLCGNPHTKITGMILYGDPPIPYILKENSIGSINNNLYAPIPIPEMKWIRSEINGRANMQQGVYLYFNLAGGMIQRYYDQRMDDVGPNREEGLPKIRQGEISMLLPYPGRTYAAINAGTSGLSSVLVHNGMGWHEIYRSSTIGKMITSMYVQTIPGFNVADKLFISEGTGIISLPIAINPTTQSGYEYFGHKDYGSQRPAIELSWMDYGLKDVNKYFHSVTVFSDCTYSDISNGEEYTTYIYYKINNQKYWKLAGKGKAYSSQEIILSKKNDLFGKRIKIKIEMRSDTDQYNTPILKAIVVKGILRLPVKRAWNITFLLEPKKDLQDKKIQTDMLQTYDQIYNWSNSETHSTPLTLNSSDPIIDKKNVFIDPASISTYQAISQLGDGSGNKEYKHIGQLIIYEA